MRTVLDDQKNDVGLDKQQKPRSIEIPIHHKTRKIKLSVTNTVLLKTQVFDHTHGTEIIENKVEKSQLVEKGLVSLNPAKGEGTLNRSKVSQEITPPNTKTNSTNPKEES